MKKIYKSFVGGLAVLTMASGCGNNNLGTSSGGSGGSSRQHEEAKVDGSNIDGFYKANFQTINGHIVGTIPGAASFTRKEDKLYVYLRLFAGAPKAWHMQAVYTGNRCPTLKDDLNKDGFIDIEEAMAVVGDVLIPLDSDPGSQSSGRNFYPLGDLSGSYQYERIINFRRFFADLQSEDKDPDDHIAKLGPDKGMTLIGKAVMVQGIAQPTPEGTVMPEGEFPNPQVPDTVATNGRRKNWQTLPIVCGVFEKVTSLPGEHLSDQVPGPVADVEEGQDRPAPDDGTITTTGGSTTDGTTTGTNESDDGHGPVSDGHTAGDNNGSTTGGSTSSTTTGGMSGGSTTGAPSDGSSGSATTGGSGSDSSSSSSSSTSTTTTTTTGSSTPTPTPSEGDMTTTGGTFGF